MTKAKKTLLTAAVAGIVGAALSATPLMAGEKKMKDKMAKDANQNVPCYGVNACGGKGQCGGKGSACAGSNKCKGQGWLPMPKSSCLAIEGGSLEPKS